MRVEVWSLPDDPEGFRLLCEPPFLAGTGFQDRIGVIGGGRLIVPADYEHLSLIVDIDPSTIADSHSSLIRGLQFWPSGDSAIEGEWVVIWEFYADEAEEQLIDTQRVVTITGLDVRSGTDDGIVYPREPTSPHWEWGAPSLIENPSFEVTGTTSAQVQLSINATAGDFLIGIDYPVGTGYTYTNPVAWNAGTSNIAIAIEAEMPGWDVFVTGAGTASNPFIIEVLVPAGEQVGWVTDSGGLTGLASVQYDNIGGLSVLAPWTPGFNPATGFQHGYYTFFGVSSEQAHTGTQSLKITGQVGPWPDSWPSGQQIVSVGEGDHWAAAWVYPEDAGRYRFILRTMDETFLGQAEANLTAGSWQETLIPLVDIPLYVGQVIVRVARIEEASSTWFLDDVTLAPGFPATTWGDILTVLMNAAFARGALDWLALGFDAALDSDGVPWDTDDFAFQADALMRLGSHVIADGETAGYEHDVVPIDPPGAQTHTLLAYNPLGRGEISSQAAIVGSFDSGRVAKRRVPYTHLLLELNDGTHVEWADPRLTGFGRRERGVRIEQAMDAAAALQIGQAIFDKEIPNLLATQVTFSDPGPVVPYQHFDVGWVVSHSLGRRAVTHDRRVQSISSSYTGARWVYVVTAGGLAESLVEPDPGGGGGGGVLDLAPAVPQGFVAIPDDGAVFLDWIPNQEGDLATYQVYQATTSGGPWTLIASIDTTQLLIGGLINGTPVWFTVSAKDLAGHESAKAPQIRVVPVASTVGGTTGIGVPSTGKIWWGAAVGGNADPGPHEASAGCVMKLRRTFFQWTHRTGYMVTTAQADLAAGRLPWVSIKTPEWSEMAAGNHDADIDVMLEALDALPGPVWLTVHHEPEGGGPGGNVPDFPSGPAAWLGMQSKVRARMTALATDNIALVPILMTYTWEAASGRDPEDWWAPGIFDFLGVDHYVYAQTTLLNSVWQDVRDFADAKGVAVAVGEWGMYGSDAASGVRVHDWYDAAIDSETDGNGARVIGLAAFDSALNVDVSFVLTGAQLVAFEDLMCDSRSETLDSDATPPTPTVLNVIGGDGSVTIGWSAVAVADLDHYNVYRSTTSGGVYVLVGTTTNLTFTNTGLTNGTPYWFKVSAEDVATNESPGSTPRTATPTAGSPPAGLPAPDVIFDSTNLYSAAKVTAEAAGTVFQFTITGGTSSGPRYENAAIPHKAGNKYRFDLGAVLDGNGTVPLAFTGTAADAEIYDCEFTAYQGQNASGVNNTKGGGAIRLRQDWLLIRPYGHHNKYTAVKLDGSNSSVTDGRLMYNGEFGAAGGGQTTGCIVDGNEIAYNGGATALGLGGDQGGTKFVHSNGLQVTNNHVHHNIGSATQGGNGIWYDINNINGEIAYNDIHDNTGAGIFYEVSLGAEIHHNTLMNNGRDYAAANPGSLWPVSSQIQISNSGGDGLWIHHNTLVVDGTAGGRGFHGITLFNSTHFQWTNGVISNGCLGTRNNLIEDNTITMSGGQWKSAIAITGSLPTSRSADQFCGQQPITATASNNLIRNNTESLSGGAFSSTPYIRSSIRISASQWASYGYN